MRKLILVALVAGTFATPALAQDAAPFTGFRVEGLAGWDRPQVPGNRSDGALYGVGTGYDVQTGGAVVGIEGEAADSTADNCVSVASAAATGNRLCTRTGRDLYVGGRVGALVAPSTLLYAKAGYTNAQVRNALTLAGTTTRTRETLDGFRVGGGVEQAVGANSFVKLEYRYSNYERDTDRHQVVAGFGFRF